MTRSPWGDRMRRRHSRYLLCRITYSFNQLHSPLTQPFTHSFTHSHNGRVANNISNLLNLIKASIFSTNSPFVNSPRGHILHTLKQSVARANNTLHECGVGHVTLRDVLCARIEELYLEIHS